MPEGIDGVMDEIRQKVIERADIIAEVISKGKDVEIRKSKDGISIAAVTKKVIKDGSNGWEEVSK